MNILHFTLVSDGSSDALLLPILEWLLVYLGVPCPLDGKWADLRPIRFNRPQTLEHKILKAVEIFPCELLFVHRDAEKIPRKQRAREIQNAASRAFRNLPSPPFICVVPVRMQEAWLLLDKEAIRKAAGNPYGRMTLELPSLSKIESVPDPKRILYQCLRTASGLNKRRVKKFDVSTRVHFVPKNIQDYSRLMKLSAFKALHDDLASLVSSQHWSN
jgi:hypothetical protein